MNLFKKIKYVFTMIWIKINYYLNLLQRSGMISLKELKENG